MDQTREEATMTSNTVVDEFLAAIENADIPGCDVWSTDATLDATVPNWRLHAGRPGRDPRRVRALVRRPGPLRRAAPVPGGRRRGELIEYTLSWAENGVPHAAHHMHLLTIRDGRIAADTVLCGGRWPASLLAEMEAADA